MTTLSSFESALDEIRKADQRTATLVRRAVRAWFENNASDVDALVVFETDKGNGVQALVTSAGHAIELEELENLDQLNDLVYFYPFHIVEEDDYDWDDDGQRVWTVSVSDFGT